MNTQTNERPTDFDPRPAYAHALVQTEAIIAAIRPDQFGDPTPCTEYDVRTLVGHVIGGMNRIAHVGGGGDFNEVEAQIDRMPDRDLVSEFQQARIRTLAAWSTDSTMATMASVPWGVVPGRVALGGYLMEALTHGWDLAQATGQPSEGAAYLAEIALGIAPFAVPGDARDEFMPFGPVIKVDSAAGPYARLAGWLGRQP